MHKFTLLLFLFVSAASFAQIVPPQAFSYSAVARNSYGTPLDSQNIGVQFTILQGSAVGSTVYQENQFTATNQFGIFTLQLGTGAVQQGAFNTIVWGSNTYYLKVGLDATGGSNFQTMGISQFLSVPYAIYADSSGHSPKTYQILSLSNDTLYLSNGGNVYLGNYRDSLVLNNDTLQLSHGNQVVLPGNNFIVKINNVPITDPSINHVMIGPTTFLTQNNYRYDLTSGEYGTILGDTLQLNSCGGFIYDDSAACVAGGIGYVPTNNFVENNFLNWTGVSPGRVFLSTQGNICYISANSTITTLNNAWISYQGEAIKETGIFYCYQVLPNNPTITGFPFTSPYLKVTFSH
jgi:hypothetical protein